MTAAQTREAYRKYRQTLEALGLTQEQLTVRAPVFGERVARMSDDKVDITAEAIIRRMDEWGNQIVGRLARIEEKLDALALVRLAPEEMPLKGAGL